ncbi:VPS35 endosomal protein sorting factor-like isoform X1 [Zingiber officinale]|uniref:VPS35 endosomal protein sorting factor-like isoform X1 n=3 Tax=Zingiber officinale TaxID=94328 RepID=UPI001C4DCFD3|nr:VPS35 endosomal protein sorting factor-like isoform X1 [Zingiber officinale]
MGMVFRSRDYGSEEIACSLARRVTDDHPLALRSSTSSQVIPDSDVSFDDPLRANTADPSESMNWQNNCSTFKNRCSSEADNLLKKEWILLKGSLTQKFTSSNTIAVSQISDMIARNNRGDKSLADIHLEEQDYLETSLEEEKIEISRKEYFLRLQELKGEINLAWRSEDRIRALKFSIKVARLLMDTSVLQFYPTLFTLVVDVMDMFGTLVWERIKKRAEYANDGTLLRCLPEDFISDDICSEAKETCYNWFCKIGSIHELVPRIYLELAILRCWRFLDNNFTSILQRLVMMMRGIADPLASAYCHLYLANSARFLYSGDDVGYLIMSLRHLSILLRRIILDKEAVGRHFSKNKRVLISLMEPSIEWIMKCIFSLGYQNTRNILEEFGVARDLSVSSWKFPCVSLVLHYLLKLLPADVISDKAVEIIDFVEQNKDISVESHLVYRRVGHKLCESRLSLNSSCAVMNRIMQVLVQYNNLYEYLMIADAHLDIILLYSLNNYLSIMLDGILKRSHQDKVDEIELDILQSILVKIINHLDRLEDLLALEHFMTILDRLYGNWRNTVYVNILHKGIRAGCIGNPCTIQFLFEVSQVLHESIDISNMNDENKQKADLISKFVGMVNFGADLERHLSFLCDSRAAFGNIEEVKSILVHSSNNLGIKFFRDKPKFLSFLKSCLAFNDVTLPSVSDRIRRMNLYLESAEIALFGGLISHSEGFIISVISCLQCLDMAEGSGIPIDEDQICSLTCKVCSLLLILPVYAGNHEDRSMYLVQDVITTFRCQSLVSPRTKVQIFCAIISLSASLSQKELLYHAINTEVVSNAQLFFGDLSFYQELSSIANLAIQILDDVIRQEPNSATQGRLALDICNCLLISYTRSQELFLKCSSLIDIAKECLHTRDKYLQSTMSLFSRLPSNLEG